MEKCDPQLIHRLRLISKLNTVYGMMAQYPVKQDIVYNKGGMVNSKRPEAEIKTVVRDGSK